jgi:hypothetical protein
LEDKLQIKQKSESIRKVMQDDHHFKNILLPNIMNYRM